MHMSNHNQQQGHGPPTQQTDPSQAAPMGPMAPPASPGATPPANVPQQQAYAQPAAALLAPPQMIGGQPPTEPPLTAEAMAWLPFVNAVMGTAPRVDAELPQNKQPRLPAYIGKPGPGKP
jgi:hypothetical protein